MKSKIVLAVAGCLAAMTLATSASAATITRTVDFTASEFVGTNPPKSPISGAFTLTFDPAVTGWYSTITAKDFNVPDVFNWEFVYDAPSRSVIVLGEYPSPLVLVQVGIFFTSKFENVRAIPVFRYADPASLASSQATQVAWKVAGVPEPAAWAIMLAGMAMLGGMLRSGRRREPAAVELGA